MNDIKQEENSVLNRNFRIALLVVIFLFGVLRFVNLNYDTPLYFTGYGISDLTDPYMYTSFARNKILEGDWDPFNYERWKSWRISIVSGVSYLVFLVAGVSRVTANISALILGLGGTALFLWGWSIRRPRDEILLIAFFFFVSNLLFFANRMTHLETGLLFISGIIVLVHFKLGKSFLGATLTGLLIALGTFAGKLTGVILLAPVMVDYLFDGKKELARRGGATLLGFLLGVVIYSALFFDWSPLSMIEYFRSQTAAVGLRPSIPKSLTGWTQMLFTYGSDGLFRFQTLVMIAAIIGTISLWVATFRKKERELIGANGYRALAFAFVWLACGLITLMPFMYRPFRYFLPFMPPLLAIAGFGVWRLLKVEFKLPGTGTLKWALPVGLVFVTIYLATQFHSWWTQIYVLGKPSQVPIDYRVIILSGLAAAIFVLMTILKRWRLNARFGAILAFTILGFFTLRQGHLVYKGLFEPSNGLERQNRDIGEILGQNSLLVGNFSPAFTIGNNFLNLVHSFGLEKYEQDIFARYPITHLAGSRADFESAQKKYPELKGTSQSMMVWAREGAYLLHRINRQGYTPTYYELALDQASLQNPDSALILLDRFLEKYPHNLTARMERVSILAIQGNETLAAPELAKISQEYSNLHYIRYLLGRGYVSLGQITRKVEYLRKARAEYKATIKLNNFAARKLKLEEAIALLPKP